MARKMTCRWAALAAFVVPACSPAADAVDDTSTGAAATSTANDSSSDAAQTSSSGADESSSTGSGTTGESGDPFAEDPPDGDSLPDGEPFVWQWIDIEGARCRDGSPAGFAYRYGTSANLMVFYAEGGACFNASSCLFSDAAIEQPYIPYAGGVFELRADNPVHDWNVVLIPYCTGDIHVGARPGGADFQGGEHQQFVGWTNNGLFLARIHPTFADVERLLVAGSSAGGFGGGSNFERYAVRFPDAEVVMIDDSGPPLADAYLAPCLQAHWREIWGITSTFLASCGDSCDDQRDGGGIVDIVAHLEQALPDATMGFISYLGDETMRQFYGFGVDECENLFAIGPPEFSPELYAAGLLDLRDTYATGPRWGTFFIEGTSHITLLDARFYSERVGGVSLRDWFAAMLAGEPSHIAP